MKCFLLGAGASIDAGLPDSKGLTRRVLARGDQRWGGRFRPPHYIVSALSAFDSARGGSASDPIDVERVFAVARLLNNRESDDIAAFVDLWSSPLRAGMIADGLQAVESEILLALEYWLGTPDDVEYLTPMVTASPLSGVITLNYDRTVEMACGNAGVACSTGFELWGGGFTWEWDPAAQVKLLKLHGSLGWELRPRQEPGLRLEDEELVTEEEAFAAGGGGRRAMVFGGGQKLRHDGPFLAMFVEMDRMLHDSEWLTIAGYSFRDEHVNFALRKWINGPSARRLSIIDPEAQKWELESPLSPAPAFVRELLEGCRSGEGAAASLELDMCGVGAAAGLKQLHGA